MERTKKTKDRFADQNPGNLPSAYEQPIQLVSPERTQNAPRPFCRDSSGVLWKS